VSRAAVSKWLSGKVSDLRNERLFAVAELCQVDARWLGTGAGDPRPGASDVRAAITNGLPELALRVGKMWSALDEPAKNQVLMLIQTLGALQNENYRRWGAEQLRAAKKREKQHH
jgi:transcriptional regulator with XRE-family HTH domain